LAHSLVEIAAALEDGSLHAMVTLVGVTKRIALWRCSLLYQTTKRETHRSAEATSAKGMLGYAGVYSSVRKSACEYGLSSETCGRLKDGTIPSHCSVETIALPRMGAPLSE
jgi:hypothetical protein